MKRARSREKLLNKMEILDRPQGVQRKAAIRFSPSIVSGYEVMKATKLRKSYGERVLFEDFSLKFSVGKRLR